MITLHLTSSTVQLLTAQGNSERFLPALPPEDGGWGQIPLLKHSDVLEHDDGQSPKPKESCV